jgi:predicted  nucleic acid-binding Zn-ribbon protein
MKRKFLEDLGLEKETIDKIMDENGNDIENAKADTEKLNTKISDLEKEITGLNGQIKDRDGQLDKLKKSGGDAEELKKQIETLQNDNKEAKKAHESEIRQLKVESAVSAALTTAKAKNIKAVRALLDLDDAKLSEDGTVVGLKEQIDKLAKADDSKFLFDDGKTKFKGTAPGEESDPKPMTVTKEQFQKMGYTDRLKVFNENKELYDSLTEEGE